MNDLEFTYWLLFMLFFAVVPIKPFFRWFFETLDLNQKTDTTPRVEEETANQRHYSQLYRPGDRKYSQIVKRSNKAKPIN